MPSPETRWTHDSVRLLAGEGDPVRVITEIARAVVLRALDLGWSGPPFDPIALADLLKIEVTPNDSVRDARTVPVGREKVRIEFNPSRPRGRMRYSLAHEIAHTFFPDCAERVRNRAAHSDLEGDDWQLEALCNIAAAELLMPVGSFGAVGGQRPDIDQLLIEQKRFDVSTEAVFIRAARIGDDPMATFCASQLESGKNAGRYRIDYLIGSRRWESSVAARRGNLLPPTTAVADCTGIGFTARKEERWGTATAGRELHVECVGIPPYPGARIPRVVGILWDATEEGSRHAAPGITIVRGDATKPRGDGSKLIVQVVNDATPNWGGGGFAAAIRGPFSNVQDDFRIWWAAHPARTSRLGHVRIVSARDDVWVASIVAQHGYGPSPTPRIRYAALRKGLEQVAAFAKGHAVSLHMPRIGCGQAGGSWPVIEELIRETVVAAGHLVTVYDPPGTQLPLPVQPMLGVL